MVLRNISRLTAIRIRLFAKFRDEIESDNSNAKRTNEMRNSFGIWQQFWCISSYRKRPKETKNVRKTTTKLTCPAAFSKSIGLHQIHHFELTACLSINRNMYFVPMKANTCAVRFGYFLSNRHSPRNPNKMDISFPFPKASNRKRWIGSNVRWEGASTRRLLRYGKWVFVWKQQGERKNHPLKSNACG